MKKWVGVLIAVLFLGSFASADTLTLVSAPNGVTGPYQLSLNGSTTTTPMICYSDKNYITYGETWTVQAFTIADVANIASVNSAFAGTLFQYNLLGYLADQLFADPGNADIQAAIWWVLGTGGADNSIYDNAVAYLNANPGYMTTDIFYIPTSWTSSLGCPQPFVVQAPEPGSMLLLGAGLLGLVGMRKRSLTT